MITQSDIIIHGELTRLSESGLRQGKRWCILSQHRRKLYTFKKEQDCDYISLKGATEFDLRQYTKIITYDVAIANKFVFILIPSTGNVEERKFWTDNAETRNEWLRCIGEIHKCSANFENIINTNIGDDEKCGADTDTKTGDVSQDLTIKELETNVSKLKDQNRRLKDDNDSLTQDIKDNEIQNETLKRNMNEWQMRKRKETNEWEMFTEDNISKLKEENQKLTANLRQIRVIITENLQKIKNDILIMKTEFGGNMQKMNAEFLEKCSCINQIQKQSAQLNAQNDELKNTNQTLEYQFTKLITAVQSLNISDNIAAVSNQISELKNKNETLMGMKNELNKAREQYIGLRSENCRIEQSLNDETEKLRLKSEELNQSNRELQSVQKQLSDIKGGLKKPFKMNCIDKIKKSLSDDLYHMSIIFGCIARFST